MLFKIFIAFLLQASLCQARASIRYDKIIEKGKFEPFIFENQILERLEELREFLKNGSPENNIPPLEPIRVDDFDYNFALNESYFDGYFDKLVISNVSDFQVHNVKFTLLPRLEFTLGLYFDEVLFEGNYRIFGNLFDINLNGLGHFRDQAKGLQVDITIDITEVHNWVNFKKIDASFSVEEDNIIFTNEYDGGSTTELPNDYTLEILNRIQTNYFPPLLTTVQVLLNDFLIGTTIDDIIHLITGSRSVKDIFQINI